MHPTVRQQCGLLEINYRNETSYACACVRRQCSHIVKLLRSLNRSAKNRKTDPDHRIIPAYGKGKGTEYRKEQIVAVRIPHLP